MERRFALGLLVLVLAGTAVSAASGDPHQVSLQAALHSVRSHDAGDARLQPRRPLTSPLWDQYDNASFGSMTSQDFEPALDQFDSSGADDFIVPAAAYWSIDGVDVQGFCDPPCGIEGFHVRLYATATNSSTRPLPGRLVCERLRQPFTHLPASLDFAIDLSSPCQLSPGAYWVSVQARQDRENGLWFWIARTIMSGSAGAAWQNPGDGFETGCVNWGRRTECDGALGDPDNVFRLRGTTLSTLPPPPPPPPPSPPPPPPPPRVRCVVPRVLGLRIATARRKLRLRHCSVGRVQRRHSRRVGRVIYQRPYPGWVKRRGYPILLVVGRR
jgi:hypothetical protein